MYEITEKNYCKKEIASKESEYFYLFIYLFIIFPQ